MSGVPGNEDGVGEAVSVGHDRHERLVRAPVLWRWLAPLVAILAASCAHHAAAPADPRRGTPVDSVTTSLWRFDEPAGVRCMDSGRFRIDMTAGNSTHASYGRIGSARELTRVIDSFVYAPYNPVYDVSAEITVEAWVYLHAFGQYELTPIAARWTEEGNTKSWLFGIVGAKLVPPLATLASPGYFTTLVVNGRQGQLVFTFQPGDASRVRACFSAQRLTLERWTHVAVSFDGAVVRFFIDGTLDAQYAVLGRIQPSRAPLLIGNYFDTRRLTAFSGELRLESGDDNPYYAFEGLIDELRLSSAARTEFPGSHR